MIDGVVLYIEMLEPELGAEALAMHQWREAGVRADLGLALEIDRQQFAIAPQVVRPLLDRRARNRRANPRVVVSDFERAEAGLAHVERTYRILLAALATFQIGDVAHRFPPFTVTSPATAIRDARASTAPHRKRIPGANFQP